MHGSGVDNIDAPTCAANIKENARLSKVEETASFQSHTHMDDSPCGDRFGIAVTGGLSYSKGRQPLGEDD